MKNTTKMNARSDLVMISLTHFCLSWLQQKSGTNRNIDKGLQAELVVYLWRPFFSEWRTRFLAALGMTNGKGITEQVQFDKGSGRYPETEGLAE